MNLDKVIKGVKQCAIQTPSACKDCPYDNPEKDARCGREMLNDVLELIDVENDKYTENVIKDLRDISTACAHREKVVTDEIDKEMFADWKSMIDRAIALISIKEAIRIETDYVDLNGYCVSHCPTCGQKINFDNNRNCCGNCAQPVLWGNS